MINSGKFKFGLIRKQCSSKWISLSIAESLSGSGVSYKSFERREAPREGKRVGYRARGPRGHDATKGT